MYASIELDNAWYSVFMSVWYLDLQLPIQSMPITSKFVSSNTASAEVYPIQHYVIKFVSD